MGHSFIPCGSAKPVEDPKQLKVEPVAELPVNLSWIVPVESAEGQTVIKLHAAVRHIHRVGGDGESLGEGLADGEIEARVAERAAAKKARDFALADDIRDRLLEQGIVLEDTKSGVRWKRK